MALHDMLEALVRHDVRFIVVGGLAAVLHGTPVSTFDLDILYARDEENVRHLHSALRELGAVFRDDARRIEPNESHLSSKGHKLLITTQGLLDALGTIERGTEFDDLIADSVEMELRGVRVRVVTLERLIRIKEQLSRPKDQAMLILLRATLDERRKRDTG